MTCVVGLKQNGKVFIGADSLGSNCDYCVTRSDPKIYRVGEMLFGFTSSFRMAQIIAYNFSIPKHHPDITTDAYLRTDFINSLRSVLKADGFAKIESNEETGGTFLLGYRGGLYVIESDFQVGEWALEFATVGSGADVAAGAMFANKDKNAERRIIKALEAAAEFNPFVKAPFAIQSI